VKRGDVGFESNKEGTVDVLAAADSAFTAVESAAPDCASQTEMYRQQAWSKLINQVGPLVNNNQLDSADNVLKRALTIYRGSPYSYYFQGSIAQRREDYATAADAFTRAVQLATPDLTAKDTSLASVREYSEFSAAYTRLKASEKLTGDQKRAGMAKAAELYKAYLKDYPQGPNAGPAQAGLTSALSQSGDSTSLASMWSEMAANPSKYTEAQLFDAGTTAFRAGQLQTAAKLMELGYQANPWLRGGLFNLANTYWKLEQWDKMLPVSRRLISIDPNNPDNYQLVAIAYQGLAKGTKSPRSKKTMNDSLVKYLSKGEKLPVRVTVDEFTHDGTNYKLTGSVENLGAAAKNVVLKVDFLDKQGNVVATQNATVSAGPKERKNFALQASGAQIAAFRYAPIT
jgi:tetratricopeptide (TPR) repeat protein